MNKGAFDEIKLRFSKKDMSFIPKDGKKRRRLLILLLRNPAETMTGILCSAVKKSLMLSCSI